MQRRKGLLLLTLVVAVLVLALSACVQAQPPAQPAAPEEAEEPAAAEEPAEVQELFFNTLFHGGDAQAMERIVERFNEEHETTQIELSQGQWAEYYAQLQNAVVAGNAPEIGISHTNRLTEIYPALTPLNDSLAGDLLEAAGINGDDYIQSLWEEGTVDGNRYLIPLDTHMWGFYYNKDIFAEAGLDPENPPQTMEEFVEAADAIRDAGYMAFHPAEDALPRKLRRAWMIFFWQLGGELFDEGYTQATFNNEQGLQALEFLVSIVQERGWNEPGTDGFKQFTAGDLGMLLAGNWFYWTAQEAGVNWGFTVIPQWFDQRVTWANSHNLVIPKQPEGTSEDTFVAAAEAIKWINENSDIWGIYGGHIPAYQPALESEALRESDTWQLALSDFTEMANQGWIHYPISHPKASQLEDAIQVHIQEAYNGTVSPEEALAAAEEEVTQILQQE